MEICAQHSQCDTLALLQGKSVPSQRARLLRTAGQQKFYTHTIMKLHLPKKLRFALLSAAVAASSATPSFAAITPWVIQNWNGYDTTAQSVTVGHDSTTGETNVIDIALDQSWNTNWSFFFTVDAATLKNEDATKLLTLLGIKMQKSNGDTYLAEGATMSNNSNNLALTTWTEGGGTGSITIPDSGDITFVLTHRQGNDRNNLSLAVYGSATSTTPITTLYSPAAQNFTAIVSGVVFGGKGNGTYKADDSNHATFAPDNTVGSYAIKKAGYSFGSTDIAADVTTFNNILTWDGGDGNNWSDASWSKNGTSGQICTANDSVIFATEGENVILDAAASAAAVAIGKNTTFSLSKNNLTVSNLSVDGGSTLSVRGGGELIVNNSLENYSSGATVGIVHAENGTSVKLKGTKIANTTVEGNLILAGSASVTLSGTVTLGSVENNLSGGGTAFANGTSAVTLQFTGESDLTNGGANKNNSRISLGGTSSITVAEGATLKTSAIYKNYNFTNADNASLTVAENGRLDLVGGITNPNTCVKSLVNHGTINSTQCIGAWGSVTNTGLLEAVQLRIYHKDNLQSSLGGTVTVGTLFLDRGTATVAKAGKLTVNTLIEGGTIDATASDSPVTFEGTTIKNTTIKGKLKLTGSSYITLNGAVTLDSVANELEGSTNGCAFISNTNTVQLKFTGTSDLTKKADGITENNFSKIGLIGASSLTIDSGAKLTTAAIYNSAGDANSNHVASNGSLTVNGELILTGISSTVDNGDASKFKSLVNNGTIKAKDSKIRVYTSATTNADSYLKAKELMIKNYGSSTSSSLGGTVEVEKLTLEGGTTNIAGEVTAGSVSTEEATAKTLGGTGGTLTLGRDDANSTSTANVTLTGSFNIKKTGTSTQVLSGDTSGYSGKLTVSEGTLKLTNGIGNSAASAEVSGNGVLAITDTITATAKSGQVGTAKNVTIDADGITRTTSGEGGVQALGEMTGMSLAFAAASTPTSISNVTMRDVTLATNGTVTYTNAKATVATVGVAAAPALYAATLSDTPATLTAMEVQKGGTASGTLTIDVTGKLISEYYGSTLEWKFLDQVTLGDGFRVVLGDILAGMVSDGLPGNGLPEVWLTVGDGESTKLGTADISNITTAEGGLLAGTSGSVDVMLTVKNIPEPTTGTLSVLALAALAARRRRK